MSRPLGWFIASVNRYFHSKNIFFWFNIGILAGITFLTFPFFHYESSNPVIFGYSIKYLLGLLLFVFLVGYLIVLVLSSGKFFNKVLFFTIIGGLLIVELSLKLFESPDYAIKDISGFYVPYMMYTGKPNSEQIYTDRTCPRGIIKLNELGFRIERPLSKQKTDREIRIFILGGSVVFNGYPLSNSIGGQLEKLFHKAGYINVKVYNFGVTSYISGQELALILHTLVDYRPDLVITYDGNNDIYLPYGYDPRAGYPFDFMALEKGMSFINHSLSWNKLFIWVLGRLCSPIINHSSLIRFAAIYIMEKQFFSIDQLRESVNYGTPEWEVSIIKKYTDNLEKSCGLAKGFDFKIACFLQPVIYFKPSLIGNEKNLLIGNEFQAYMKRQYDRIKTIFKYLGTKYAKERCLFVDLSDVFKNCKEEIFYDFAHTNYKGNKIIATQIYDCIIKNGILDDKCQKHLDPVDRQVYNLIDKEPGLGYNKPLSK